jgi:hypothetical protein
MISNHVGDNYKKRSLRYFFTCLSFADDPFYVSCATSIKREISEHTFESTSKSAEIILKESWKLTEAQKAIANNLIAESIRFMGPLPLTKAKIAVKPHLHLPWLYRILQRMEKVTHIREPIAQKKASKGFVQRQLQELVDFKNLPRKFRHTLEHHVLKSINNASDKTKFVECLFNNINKGNSNT